MKAIKISVDGFDSIHVPVDPARQIYVGVTNTDDELSVIAHSLDSNDTEISEKFWLDEGIEQGTSISITVVDVPDVDTPNHSVTTPVGRPRCSFCGEFERQAGDFYRGRHRLAKICPACLDDATSVR